MSLIIADRKFYISLIVIATLAGGVWLARVLYPSSYDIEADISRRRMYLTDSLQFVDQTSFAQRWRWDFGDGVVAFDKSGHYRYSNPGNYIVTLTINDRYIDTFHVKVVARTVQHTLSDTILTIEGPTEAMQYENLVFRVKGVGAKLYRWTFGDNKQEDAKDPFVLHAYDQPGTYIIELHTDINQYPIRYPITITPSFMGALGDTSSVDDKFRALDEDFKYRLQKIANHENFRQHYYYLVNKYLCKNEKIPVVINGQKFNEFFSYCSGLHYDNHVYIQQAKVTVDTAFSCVTKLEINQQKQEQISALR
ncbi:PKD domain-containing protein [Cytophagaceae bacterium DM2B3-1]|uniref:PKD domain-containing protein n=1 Tax=Xanthocytophaga flava TaxID=3048013 RepID=A0ABT7CKU8_9BACT|nr:PKD domain-containing protein [Xanthocytophaga flavus]MDJ1469679.1 PKD domain-containing protein [Xanthocytophaga flavus]MDJ1493627.1 PKD domain-containing protein [Xanthocytophaga flavus]